MSIRALYPCTGGFTLLGATVFTCGLISGSFLISAQGLYLLYMGIHMTFTIWNKSYQEGLLSE